MPTLVDIFTHIESHRAESINRLIEYVSRPSISAHGIGIGETAEWLTTYLRSLGFDTEAYPTKGWPMYA